MCVYIYIYLRDISDVFCDIGNPFLFVISAHFNPERREKAKKLQFGDLLPKIPCRSYLGVNAATASGLSNQ